MRLLGILEGQTHAESLVAYLITCDISTHVEPIEGRPDAWELWVRDEDRMPEAMRELDAYRQTPSDPKYSSAVRVAQDIVREKRQQRIAAAKNIKQVRSLGVSRMATGRMQPLTVTLCVSCVAISLLTNFCDVQKLPPTLRAVYDQMKFVDMKALEEGKSAHYSLDRGEFWRILTPIFLHGSVFHLLCNVLGLWQLGQLCERMEGTVRYAMLILLTAAGSSLLQGLMPYGRDTIIPLMFQGNPNFVGISGVVFGLFGFVWVKTQLRPDLGIRINEVSVIIMFVFLIAGFLGAFEKLNIANLGHLGGLLVGMFLGWVTANCARPLIESESTTLVRLPIIKMTEQNSQIDQVHVALGDRSYVIWVGTNILSESARIVHSTMPKVSKVICIADQSIVESHVARIRASLDQASVSHELIVLESGEKSKSVAQLARLWDEMFQLKADRASVVVAIGGGVVGDLAGFAAATYTRGVRLVQVPTTLLSQVDSSVGGKTGINLPQSKNMIGSFWQPSLVLIDTETLTTLPRREYLSGVAEVVKYGVILDADFFEELEKDSRAICERDPSALRRIIVRSCQLKAQVVSADERETSGLRAVLNYGHTFAHALEAGTEYGRLLHGEAVAIGMMMAANLAAELHLIGHEFVARQRRLLAGFELPTEFHDITCKRMWELMQHDKKVHSGRIGFILPTRLGHVESFANVDRAVVLAVLKGMGVPE